MESLFASLGKLVNHFGLSRDYKINNINVY